ncbi:EAL domain-containing protein [Noviherbaspirillum sp. CPCC 100848]|uniref:EAL domain-containing protein n=1 Tax=Noviherbaspirillum album TaxID=3080276 RepID=A0ABU6J5F9_9BURK|nr:EAL domain-containing protein [Noviherbaspirillum sp. CPCC 100848]MEC4718585.1 EAL domain-containing protein [Noviherbaspirillum sp. CPCC 100848]
MPCLSAFVAFTLLYYLSCLLSFSFGMLPGMVSPLWPPAALAVCAILRLGYRIAPGVLIGAILSTVLSSGIPLISSLAIGIGATLEACTVVYLIDRFYPSRRGFIHQGPIFRFVGIAVLCSVIGATFGTAAMSIAYPEQSGAPDQAALTWLTWLMGNATGMIVGVPLLMSLNFARGQSWPRLKLLEAGLFLALLLTATQIAFAGLLPFKPIVYLPIPFLLWAAFRFNFASVNWTTAIICAAAAWHTADGLSPFVNPDVATSLMLLMVYICVIGTTGLALSSLVYRHAAVEKALRAERDSLEQRVRERTDALMEDIEARKHVERELAQSESELSEAQSLAQIGSWNWNLETNEFTWSDELYRLYKVSKNLFPSTLDNVRQLIHPDDREAMGRAIAACRDTGQPFYLEYRIIPPGGSVRNVAGRGQLQKDENGRAVKMFGTVQDITHIKEAEVSLREAEERYRTVVELSPDAILAQQDGRFVLANQAAVCLFGASHASQIIGRSLYEFLLPQFHDAVRQRIEHVQEGEAVGPAELGIRRLDGVAVDLELNSSVFMYRGRPASLFIARDITERKRTAQQMAYLAHYDSLTGLPNRILLYQRLEHALSIAERPGRSVEVLFLDLDRFKLINDTLGHAAGDLVLKEAARRLENILRESDTVARLGGDEFVVLVENVDEPHRGNVIAEKILSAFRPPLVIGNETLVMSTSIGISSYPSDGTDVETLLKHADTAMYQAKQVGRNNYRYYSPEMNRHAEERIAMETALSRAIENNELFILYQPKMDVMSNRISGMEALLRWNHPVFGAVPPQRFIRLAEEVGLIHSIGYWAIRNACRQNREWQRINPARMKVAVNLSARQLGDDKLIDNITNILAETMLEARYLELEIAESAVMADPDKAIAVLNALRDIGVSVAIDDFGAGYSSLAYLKQFPIRAVKIDQSFVQGVPFSRSDAAITKAIINLAHSLECSVIAEGAETQQQFDFLRDNDCDSVQGFFFSEPVSAEHFTDLLRVQANLHIH